ncbi:unnamed protein product, partial [Coregonus sp. 'balchen']
MVWSNPSWSGMGAHSPCSSDFVLCDIPMEDHPCVTETQLNVKIARLSKKKCDTMIKLSEMEILLKDYDARVQRLRAYLQSSQEERYEETVGTSDLQKLRHFIYDSRSVMNVRPMEPLKEHHGGDARIPYATNTQSTNKNWQLEENNASLHQKLHITEKKYRQMLNKLTKALIQGKHAENQHIDTLQDKIQTISVRRTFTLKIVQLTSEKLKIDESVFLTKTTPKPLKTTKTNKPSLKTCKVLKAFKALIIFNKMKK